MNTSELFNLTVWIKTEIEGTSLQKKYQELQSILQQNTVVNRQKAAFHNQKEALLTLIKNIPLYSLTKDQIAFLDKLGIGHVLGEEGINTIEDVLYRNALDMATAAGRIQQMIQVLNSGIEKARKINDGMTGCVLLEQHKLDDDILVRISFTGHASMANVKDFRNWGKTWYEIGRGIAMVHNSSPEDIRIVGATNGSIVIEMAVIASIATTASSIILAALKVAERVLEIKKKAEEIRGLKLLNKKLALDLEKEAETEKKGGVVQISAEMIKELNINLNTEGDKVTAFEKAVANLVNFIESGGEVDFVAPMKENKDEDGDTVSPEYESLRNTFTKIRQLENRVKLLES